MMTVTVLLLGATGDLARRKLLPAFHSLLKHQHERLKLLFIGVAKDTGTAQQLLFDVFDKGHRDAAFSLIEQNFFYVPLNFMSNQGFQKLSDFIIAKEQEYHMSGNRLIYCAVPAQLYCPLTEHLAHAQILFKDLKKEPFCRVVYEKPFGWDTASACEIDHCIKKFLEEEQIYRVDHYLTKALITSIGLDRFSNSIFKPLWNSHSIDNVQIILSETESVKNRGAFYDAFGALKDVVQNHMVQLLSLIAMEPPAALASKELKKVKTEALKNIQVIDGLLGQYIGYKDEPHVDPHSTTETFAVLKCLVSTPRWHGVPFYLKTGKYLNHKSSDIFISFKRVSKEIIGAEGFFDPDILTIRISPNTGFSLQLNIQRGPERHVVPISMDFCYRCVFGLETPHSYEILLHDLLMGERAVSVDLQEIDYGWKIIETVKELSLPLYQYQPGTKGPYQTELFAQKNGFTWHG